jgi:hypothetical protein
MCYPTLDHPLDGNCRTSAAFVLIRIRTDSPLYRRVHLDARSLQEKRQFLHATYKVLTIPSVYRVASLRAGTQERIDSLGGQAALSR